ncbi:MAG: CCA tRNA nucleotidyltransferase [Chlamydiales bacterium]
MNVYVLATEIVNTLFEAGYTAYFSGGWVRDKLLGKESDEIDIATSAPPSIIQDLFDKTVPLGVSFGVVVVVLKGINFEVTTFRKDAAYQDGRHPTHVDFSTPEKDALRRDFTINGMFFDPLTETIYDYVGGQEDLKNQLIRAIGEPAMRFNEDRLRLIRAVRFAAKLGFSIEEKTKEAICAQAASLFPSVSIERVWQEFNKMAAAHRLDQSILMLHRFKLLEVIFPSLKETSLDKIEKWVSPFPYFPVNIPTIAYLMELFPHFSLEEKIQICRYLKTTSGDIKLVTYLTQAAALFRNKVIEQFQWAHFYANPYSEYFINIEAAKIMPPERSRFLQDHAERIKSLDPHIHRIQTRRPLVNAELLKKEGIKPGKKMGALLKEAERLVINNNLASAEEALNLLKQSSLL